MVRAPSAGIELAERVEERGRKPHVRVAEPTGVAGKSEARLARWREALDEHCPTWTGERGVDLDRR